VRVLAAQLHQLLADFCRGLGRAVVWPPGELCESARPELLDRADGLARVQATRTGELTRIFGVQVESRFIEQIEYLGKDGEPVRRYQVVETGQVDGALVPRTARLDDLVAGTHTVMRLTDVQAVDSIPDRIFSRASL
jgi:hypothetical protein